MRLVATIASALLLGGCANNNNKTGEGHGDLSAALPADMAIAWNDRVIATAGAEDHFLTLKGVRTASMMHLAMHDALNAIQPRFEQFAHKAQAKDADATAAAAQAAYEIAVSQYPNQKEAWDTELNTWLGKVADGAAKTAGIELGKAAAGAIVKMREGDGWDGQAEYKFSAAAPGVYAEFKEHSGTPEGFVFGAGWAKAKPFALQSLEQFRVAKPPELKSPEYAKAYAMVKDVGSTDSKTRTQDQTHQAMWWKDFADNSMNRLARQLAAKEKMDLWAASRMFALININIFDGYIAVFDNKFHYNHWRPYTAIRFAGDDGNPETSPDPKWDNTHKHTYAFPSYPSAHGTVCASTLTTLAKTFNDSYEFTLETPEVNQGGPFSPPMKLDPPTRSFKSFSSAAEECAMSRVYLGIHFPYDSMAGNKLGTQISNFIWDNYLKPL